MRHIDSKGGMKMEIRESDSVEIVHLNNLPSRISSRDLGTRQVGLVGIVKSATVPGFDTDAIRVDHREPFGEPSGTWGIYFLGEYERIYNLLPQ